MWDDPKALNKLTVALLACALAALVAAGLLWVSRQPAFAIRHVVVQGELKEVNPAHLQAVTREALRGNFFTLNLDAARVAYARVPWVRAVSVRRLWPDRLEVTVSEHQPLARWSAWSGESGLVNTAGELFQADYAGELPGFAGPAGAA